MNPPPFTQWVEFTWMMLAVAGGVARHLDAHIRKNAAKFRLDLLLMHAVMSGFSGYMAAQIALRVDPEWALVAAGVGGYLGTQALDFARDIFIRRMGGDPEKDGKPSPDRDDDKKN